MNIREYLNNNSAVATIVAVAVLMIALGIMVLSGGGGGAGGGQVFYYDLNTQTFSRQPQNSPSPLDLGNGTYKYFDGDLGSAVRATIFACDEDLSVSDGMSLSELEAEGGKIIALYRFTPEAQARQVKVFNGQQLTDEELANDTYDSSLLVSDVKGQTWLPESSEPAANLLGAASQMCGGERAFYIAP